MVAKPRLLDLFCGAGGAAVGYARAGFKVVGVDHVAQPRYPFEFVQADALELLVELLCEWGDDCESTNAVVVGANLDRSENGIGDGISRALVGVGNFDVEMDENSAFHEVPPVGWSPSSKAGIPCQGFDAIHASPPCQAFTDLKGMWNAKSHEDLLTPTRELLIETGLPYVIENVPGAPMNGQHFTLCGSAFRLGTDDAELRRHRHFETNFPVLIPPCTHGWRERVIGVYGGHGRDRRRKVNTQDYTVAERRVAMGIDWMTGEELSQAIPPAYTEHIGAALLEHLKATVAA